MLGWSWWYLVVLAAVAGVILLVRFLVLLCEVVQEIKEMDEKL